MNNMIADVYLLLAQQVPDPAPQAPPGLSNVANTFLGWLKWGAVIAGVGGLIWCAVMMNMGRRGRHNTAVEGAQGIPWVIGGISLTVLSSGLVSTILGL